MDLCGCKVWSYMYGLAEVGGTECRWQGSAKARRDVYDKNSTWEDSPEEVSDVGCQLGAAARPAAITGAAQGATMCVVVLCRW
jgi:hypothetical protein